MAEVSIVGVAVRGPGLDGWTAARPILSGALAWCDGEVALPAPVILPPNERRRASPSTRLALTVASEAIGMAGVAPDAVSTVWGSGAGDGRTVDALLRTLAGGEAVSPTQFHNSVHNAVGGYWGIGAGSRQPVSCVGGSRESWAAALLPAVAEAVAGSSPVLLCVYDVPMPEPLHTAFPIAFPFACALVLARAGGVARLRVGWSRQPVAEPEGTEAGNPAARALPLLRALARRERVALSFGLDGGSVQVAVAPC